MLPKAKLKKLERACNKIADVPNINHGGCGIAALALYRWCLANKIQPDGFVMLDDDGLAGNRKAIERGELDNLSVPNHIVLYVDNWWYCDSSGTYEPDNLPWEYVDTLHVSEEVLLHLVNHAWNWNDEFDREYGVPEIAETLKVDLSDVRL
jgi:hypothetical protein